MVQPRIFQWFGVVHCARREQVYASAEALCVRMDQRPPPPLALRAQPPASPGGVCPGGGLLDGQPKIKFHISKVMTMSKRTSKQKDKQAQKKRRGGRAAQRVTGKQRPDAFWQPFIEYNELETSSRQDALSGLGIAEKDEAVLGVLTKSHFVIPGVTRLECQMCGECCRYARKVAQLTYEPCLFLTTDNKCSKHDERYIVCQWFPFWVYNHPKHGPMLTIKPYCTGFGKGPLIDYAETLKRILKLAVTESKDDDGAFVIHEVLHIPGHKDWAFPSKRNIDALMLYIKQESKKSSQGFASPLPLERAGEVHYAHHYTSGLLGSRTSPMATVNEAGLITDANEAFCQLFNREQIQIIGRSFPSFFINPDRVEAGLKSCFSHGKETASPQRLRLPDESAIPVLLNGLVFRDRSDGLVHSVLICINPVSATVFTEVSQSRTYARGLLEASLDALMVIDKDGGITDVNEATMNMTGRPREGLLGHPFRELFTEQDRAGRGVDTTFKDGMVRGYELVAIHANGECIPVSFNATVYRDSEGVVQGVFASARDIRERVKMMRELENAKNYARGLIECCLDLMVTIDRKGVIMDANNAASTITGRKREELIGSPFCGYFDDEGRAQKGVELTFSQGQVQNYDLNLIAGQGKKVPTSFNATLYRDPQGDVQGVFAIARTKGASPA